MPIHLHPYRIVDFQLSERRQIAIRHIDLFKDKGPWTDQEIEAAKRLITQMGIWDKFVDKVFNDDRKARALEVIAEKVICDMAYAQARPNTAEAEHAQTGSETAEAEHAQTGSETAEAEHAQTGSETAEGDLHQRRLAAHAAFLDLLAPDTLTLSTDHKVEAGRVWLKPDTKEESLNNVLAISVPIDQAVGLLHARGCYRECALIYSRLVDDLALPHIELYYKTTEAKYWTLAGDSLRAAKAWEGAAQACATCQAAHEKELFADDKDYADDYAQSFESTMADILNEIEKCKRNGRMADPKAHPLDRI